MNRIWLACGTALLGVTLVGCGSSTSDIEEFVDQEGLEWETENLTPDWPEEDLYVDCDPNYDGACVPNVDYDLDCPDIEGPVYVIGSDIHRFDRDGDGVGCEPY